MGESVVLSILSLAVLVLQVPAVRLSSVLGRGQRNHRTHTLKCVVTSLAPLGGEGHPELAMHAEDDIFWHQALAPTIPEPTAKLEYLTTAQ